MERTVWSPGTLLTASSIGRVIVTSIWSIGATPLSTPITIRGKLVSGNTEIGIENPKYVPTTARAMAKNRMGRDSRSNQGLRAGGLRNADRSSTFSLGLWRV